MAAKWAGAAKMMINLSAKKTYRSKYIVTTIKNSIDFSNTLAALENLGYVGLPPQLFIQCKILIKR